MYTLDGFYSLEELEPVLGEMRTPGTDYVDGRLTQKGRIYLGKLFKEHGVEFKKETVPNFRDTNKDVKTRKKYRYRDIWLVPGLLEHRSKLMAAERAKTRKVRGPDTVDERKESLNKFLKDVKEIKADTQIDRDFFKALLVRLIKDSTNAKIDSGVLQVLQILQDEIKSSEVVETDDFGNPVADNELNLEEYKTG